MADYLTTNTELTSIANAIRTKGGTTASLVYPSGFVTAIENLPTNDAEDAIIERNITYYENSTVSKIGSYAFTYCTYLRQAVFTNCQSIGGNAFYYCMNLKMASFPRCETINGGAFRVCTRLMSLYLLGSSFVTLSNSNAFLSTPMSTLGGNNGTIYVPASMLASYKTMENWSIYSARFVGV